MAASKAFGPYAPLLSGDLWRSAALTRGPAYLQTLYIARHSGPRTDRRYLAHRFWEFTVVLNGEGTLDLRAAAIPVRRQMLVLIPPAVEHRETSSSMDTIWIGCAGRLMAQAPRQGAVYLVEPALTRAAEELWLFAERRHGPIGFEIDGGLLRFIGSFFRALAEGCDAAPNEPIARALALLHERLAEALDFSELARGLGLSEGYFYRLFKRRTGITPSQYLTKLRVERACRWLRLTQASMAEIGAQVGYPDAFYFSRVFKKHTGLAPLKYRQREPSPRR